MIKMEVSREEEALCIIAMPHLAHISLLVHNYDEAIAFYTRLGFELVEDTLISEQHKR